MTLVANLAEVACSTRFESKSKKERETFANFVNLKSKKKKLKQKKK